jgi:hypothetical protein
VERVTVSMRVDFYEYLLDASTILMGGRSDTVVYVREGDGSFRLDPQLSAASAKHVEEFYDDPDSRLTNDKIPGFNFNGFLETARRGNAEQRKWLGVFVRRCGGSKEAAQLKAALASRQ